MMTRQERAKQFAPFDAMKGLQEALRDREERHERVGRREISEEDAASISYVLKKLSRGMKVNVTFYDSFHERRERNTVTDVNINGGYIALEEKKIFIDDIYEIEIIEFNNLITTKNRL